MQVTNANHKPDADTPKQWDGHNTDTKGHRKPTWASVVCKIVVERLQSADEESNRSRTKTGCSCKTESGNWKGSTTGPTSIADRESDSSALLKETMNKADPRNNLLNESDHEYIAAGT